MLFLEARAATHAYPLAFSQLEFYPWPNKHTQHYILVQTAELWKENGRNALSCLQFLSITISY